jgi:hypothetical protein
MLEGRSTSTLTGDYQMQAQQKFLTADAEFTFDGLTGEGCDMFPSGSVSVDTDMMGGEATALFPSGSAPAATFGEETGLFPSGSAPTTSTATVDGEGTYLFPSGS